MILTNWYMIILTNKKTLTIRWMKNWALLQFMWIIGPCLRIGSMKLTFEQIQKQADLLLRSRSCFHINWGWTKNCAMVTSQVDFKIKMRANKAFSELAPVPLWNMTLLSCGGAPDVWDCRFAACGIFHASSFPAPKQNLRRPHAGTDYCSCQVLRKFYLF